jgi:hypothetical protein
MKQSALAVAGALMLTPLLLLGACPSLGEIGVGGPLDATVDRGTPRAEGGADAQPDTTPRDASVDVRCTAEVGTDPHNCGRCGHDCLGGGCTGGACEAVVLYAGSDTPTSIVVDGPSVLVTVDTRPGFDGYLFRCEAADCKGTRTILATGLPNPWFAVGHGGMVFWDNGGTQDGGTFTAGSIVGCPETGCSDSGPVVYSPEGGGLDGGASLSGLALDSTYLYWAATNNNSLLEQTGTILRCATVDCAGTLVPLVSGASFIPIVVQVDPSFVYWTDLGTNQVLRCKLPSCGGNPQVFANNQNSPSGLALYGGSVYWTQGADEGGILRCPASGCGTAPTTLATEQANPFGLAVDDSGVYWTNINDGTVRHCPLDGCSKPTVLARTEAPFAIALDALSVYFTNSTTRGGVLRVAK